MRIPSAMRFGLLLMGLLMIAACQEQGSTIPDVPSTAYPGSEGTELIPNSESTQEIPPIPRKAVAILVVDDFQSLGTEPDSGEGSEFPPPETEEGGNCVVAPDGQIFRGEGLIFRGEGLDWVTVPDVSHGVLVYNQLQSLIASRAALTNTITGPALFSDLSAAGFSGTWSTIGLDWLKEVTIWEMGDQQIYLAMVDTSQYDSAVIADRLQAAMEAVNSQYDVADFVWNMSFGFVPCDLTLTAEEYQAFLEQSAELQALQDSIYQAVEAGQLTPEAADGYLQSQARLLKAYQDGGSGTLPEWLANDPVLQLLEGDQSPGSVIAVASSGNSGLSYPFAPALWDEVIAVSSETKDPSSGNPVSADYANDGEVMMPDSFTFNGQSVIGTSFAAPQLSWRAAHYLLQGGAVSCTGAVDTASPPFDYATAAGPWNNLPLPTAQADYCPTFPP